MDPYEWFLWHSSSGPLGGGNIPRGLARDVCVPADAPADAGDNAGGKSVPRIRGLHQGEVDVAIFIMFATLQPKGSKFKILYVLIRFHEVLDLQNSGRQVPMQQMPMQGEICSGCVLLGDPPFGLF